MRLSNNDFVKNEFFVGNVGDLSNRVDRVGCSEIVQVRRGVVVSGDVAELVNCQSATYF